MRIEELQELIAVHGPNKTLGELAAELREQAAAEMATRYRRVEARLAAEAACAAACGPHPGCRGACGSHP